jgi:predicted ATP-dependent endonuclease of OLD family
MKVKIKDFQSIKKAELEIKGFTTVVGRTNIGKSAIVRSIHGALFNKEGDSFVREGASHTEVNLDCPQVSIHWKKGGGKNAYVIDGEVLESVGRGAPEHIAKAGFRELEVNRNKISVQIAGQFNPIFLLDPSQVSGAAAAEVISDVGRLSEVQEALRNCTKDRKNLESLIRVREKDVIKVEKDLLHYRDVPEDHDFLKSMSRLVSEIDQIQAALDSLERLQDEVTNLNRVLDSLEGVDHISIPSYDDSTLLEDIVSYSEAYARFREQESLLRKLEGVDALEVEDEDFDILLKEIQAYVIFHDHVKVSLQDEQRFMFVENISPLEDLDIRQDTSEYQEVVEMWDLFTKLSQSMPEVEGEIQTLTLEMDSCHEELHAILQEAGECPTCGMGVTK